MSKMEIIQLIIGIVLILAVVATRYGIIKRILITSKLEKEDIKYYDVLSIYKSLKNNKEPNPKLITKYAKDLEKRTLLFECLLKFDRLDLFPQEYNTLEKVSESYLANWLNLHNEYDSLPDEIAFYKSYEIENDMKVLIFKFKNYLPHLYAEKGCMYGYVAYKKLEDNSNINPNFIYSNFNDELLDKFSLEDIIKNDITRT